MILTQATGKHGVLVFLTLSGAPVLSVSVFLSAGPPSVSTLLSYSCIHMPARSICLGASVRLQFHPFLQQAFPEPHLTGKDKRRQVNCAGPLLAPTGHPAHASA